MHPRLARLWTNHPEPLGPWDCACSSADSMAHGQSFLSGTCKMRHWDTAHFPAHRQRGRRTRSSLSPVSWLDRVWGIILPLHHSSSSSSSSATWNAWTVYPGLSAGQHSPMCLASGPVCCYKGHFLSLVGRVTQPGVSGGLVGEGGEKELCSYIAKVCLNYPCSSSVLEMERSGAKHLL